MRDRKVARTAAQCTGMVTAMTLVTPMARSSSESTPHDRPISLHGGRRRIKGSIWLAVPLCRNMFLHAAAARRAPRASTYVTCSKCGCTAKPRTHTVSVDVSHLPTDGYEWCLWSLFQPVVGASSVERPVPRAVYLSYLTIPGPRCRGTRLRRSTGTSGTRTKPWYP